MPSNIGGAATMILIIMEEVSHLKIMSANVQIYQTAVLLHFVDIKSWTLSLIQDFKKRVHLYFLYVTI